MDNPNTLLRTARIRRKWSQAALADLMGVSVSTIKRWEQGTIIPYSIHQTKLSALFGLTPEQLGFIPPSTEEPASVQNIPPPAPASKKRWPSSQKQRDDVSIHR